MKISGASIDCQKIKNTKLLISKRAPTAAERAASRLSALSSTAYSSFTSSGLLLITIVNCCLASLNFTVTRHHNTLHNDSLTHWLPTSSAVALKPATVSSSTTHVFHISWNRSLTWPSTTRSLVWTFTMSPSTSNPSWMGRRTGRLYKDQLSAI